MATPFAYWRYMTGLVCLGLAAGGCGPSDAIRSYTIPRPAARAERILAAIVPGPEQTWFFKVAAAPEEIQPHVDAFRQLIQSVRFEGTAPARPEWKLPAGWRQQEGSGMRFATLRFGGQDDPLELTVIPLPTPDGDPRTYAVSNINRWREQIGLAPMTADALDAESESVALASGTARVVDMVGQAVAPGAAPDQRSPNRRPAPRRRSATTRRTAGGRGGPAGCVRPRSASSTASSRRK